MEGRAKEKARAEVEALDVRHRHPVLMLVTLGETQVIGSNIHIKFAVI